MTEKKYAIFQISGGLGKHIAATAVAQAIVKAHPDRKLVVVCGWPELWADLPFVHRVYPLGSTQYFYEEYIDGVDSLIFAQEPYFTTTHVHKTHKLVESWCMMYGLDYSGEKPMIRINPEQRRAIKNFYTPHFNDKPVLLLHTNGGMFNNERPFCWSRDMPLNVAEKVANHFGRTHTVMQVTRPKSPKLVNAMVFDAPLSNIELAGLLELTDKRLLIDSSLQHAAAALGLKSTVLWNATSSKIFGNDIHDNIQAKAKPRKALPGSYLFDYQFDANEHEFPYDEGDLDDLFNIDEIIASLEGSQNQPKGFKNAG